MQQDPTFKDIFAYPFMVRELLDWFVGGVPGGRALVDALDLAGLRRVPEQSTTGPAADKHRFANDIAWRAPFRDGGDGDGGWLHLVLMLEVQGTVDHLMALRVRNYVDNHHMDAWRGRRFGARDRLAPVLPLVFHAGPSRWTAAPRVIDLVTPGASGARELPGLSSRADGLFAGEGYLVLDAMRLAPGEVRRDNAAALLAALCDPDAERLPGQLAALAGRLSAPELRPLLEVMLSWALWMARRRSGVDLGDLDMAELDELNGADEAEAYFAARRRAYRERYRAEDEARGLERGMARGLEQGVARGLEQGLAAERDLLRRLAERKFGAAVAARLAGLLAETADAEALARAGEMIIDCETGEALVTRLREG